MCGKQADHDARPYRTPSFDCTANLGRHFGGGILAVIVLTGETEGSELAVPAPKQPPKGRGLASGSGARGARADCLTRIIQHFCALFQNYVCFQIVMR